MVCDDAGGVDGNGVQLTVGERHDEVQCIATSMCGVADMLHHVERRQHITETTTVWVSRQLKSDIKVPANHNRTCIDDAVSLRRPLIRQRTVLMVCPSHADER